MATVPDSPKTATHQKNSAKIANGFTRFRWRYGSRNAAASVTMGFLLAITGVYFITASHAEAVNRTVYVATAAQLHSALANAQPGDVIKLADNTYHGTFTSTVSGTSYAPITVTGSRNAILDGGSLASGAGLSLGTKNTTKSIGYWNLVGFTVSKANQGIVFDRVQNSTISGVYVHDIGEEGIHLRDFSSNNVVKNNRVTKTGLFDQRFGEGLYVGSAYNNWSNSSQSLPDHSNSNQLVGNSISYTGAESIDIKEATHSGLISGNTFDGHDMCPQTAIDCDAADSFIDIKGEGWTVSDNVGTYVHTVWNDAMQKNDGIQVRAVALAAGDQSGDNNSFTRNNLSDVGGYGFNIADTATGNAVACDNAVANAASGFGNLSCQ
jgi:parallel beta-helix repeat protein